MIASPIGRWALWGTSPAGRYLLERRQVCAEFPLVSVGAAERISTFDSRLASFDGWQALLADPLLDGIVLAVPLAERAARVCAALSAGKSVLVEGWPCLNSKDLAQIDAARRITGRAIGVFFAQPAAADFQAAQAAIRSGRLGTLRQVTCIAYEFALPAEIRSDDDLALVAAGLLRQFLELTGESPGVTLAWIRPETSGIQLHLTCPSGATVWLEQHRRAYSGLRTGWVLEGTLGAYRQGRLMTLAGDGELRDEPIAGEVRMNDLWRQLLQLVSDSTAMQASWRLTAESIRLWETHDPRTKSSPSDGR